MRRDKSYVTRRVLGMNVDGCRSKRPRKGWIA